MIEYITSNRRQDSKAIRMILDFNKIKTLYHTNTDAWYIDFRYDIKTAKTAYKIQKVVGMENVSNKQDV